MKEHLRTRMKEQEEHEVAAKKKGEDDSRKFLDVRGFLCLWPCLLLLSLLLAKQ